MYVLEYKSTSVEQKCYVDSIMRSMSVERNIEICSYPKAKKVSASTNKVNGSNTGRYVTWCNLFNNVIYSQNREVKILRRRPGTNQLE